MKKLIPNTDKVPVRDTIYVSNLKDPRLKSYQDSISVRNKFSQKFQPGTKTRPLTSQEKKFWKDDETGLIPNLVEYRKINGKESGSYFGHYKKPVQPVAYRPEPKVTTKLDTVPVVKTSPTPLTKKQYYEVPDANGKINLLTPEQFSKMSSGNKNDVMSKSPIMNKPKYFYEMNSSGKKQLIPENKIREYMQSKNK
jgi:hypothetical protein